MDYKEILKLKSIHIYSVTEYCRLLCNSVVVFDILKTVFSLLGTEPQKAIQIFTLTFFLVVYIAIYTRKCFVSVDIIKWQYRG